MTASDNGDRSSVRFPTLSLLVATIGIGGVVAMREVAVQTGMSGVAYWTGVFAFGSLFGLGMSLFSPRFARWTQCRKAAGKRTWWERLP